MKTVLNETSNHGMVVVWFFNQINNQIDILQMTTIHEIARLFGILTVAFSSALPSMFPFPCLDLHGPYDVACRFHQCSRRQNIITRLFKILGW